MYAARRSLQRRIGVGALVGGSALLGIVLFLAGSRLDSRLGKPGQGIEATAAGATASEDTSAPSARPSPGRDRVSERVAAPPSRAAPAARPDASETAAKAPDDDEAPAADELLPEVAPPPPVAAPPEPGHPSPPPGPATTETDAAEEASPWRRLSGWVLDAEGIPVAGLEVTAVARRLAPRAGDGGSAVEASAIHAPRRTVTNGDGSFVLQRLVDGEYEVRTARTDRYDSTRALLRAGESSAVLVVTERRRHVVTVRGVVENIRGEFLAGVRVVPLGRPGRSTRSDELGAYELTLTPATPHRDLAILFAREAYQDKRVRLRASDLRGAAELELDVLLRAVEEAARVEGSLLGSDGRPVARAPLELYSAELARRFDALSDGDGRFSFAAVEPALDYRLSVRPPRDYQDYLEEGLVIDTGGLRLDLVLERLDLARLSGRMVDTEGRPLPGWSLWLRTAQETSRHAVAVTGDLDGRFLVEPLPAGELTLRTGASPHLTFSGIELVAGDPRDVQLILDVGAHSLDGFVVDERGLPLSAARVVLTWSASRGGVFHRSLRRSVADANGYFLFTGLGAGRHALAVSAPGFRPERRELAVPAGPGEVSFRLERTPP